MVVRTTERTRNACTWIVRYEAHGKYKTIDEGTHLSGLSIRLQHPAFESQGVRTDNLLRLVDTHEGASIHELARATL